MADLDTDLVVVGTGAAGCGAALAGLARGLRVVVVEKSERLGGATASSLGGLWVPENHLMAAAGFSDSLDAARQYMRFLSGGYALAPMTEAYLHSSRIALRDFAEAGVPFRLLRGLPDHYYPQAEGSVADGRLVEAMPIARDALGPWGDRLEEGVYNEAGVSWGDAIAWGGLGARQAWPEHELEARRQKRLLAAGPALVGQFLARLMEAGVPILAGFRAERLLVEDGRVAGVEGPRRIRASRGVVLASGGYEGSPELVNRFEGLPDWMNIFPRSVEGDGMVMGSELGAAVWRVPNNLAMLVGYAIPSPTETGEQVFFSAGLRGLSYPHSIVVNDKARRFCDESQFQHVVAGLTRFDLGAHRHPNLPAWMLFDAQYLRRYSFARRPPGAELPDWVMRAQTLPELAVMLGLDAAALADTIAQFNAGAERGEDPEHGRGSSAFARSTAGDPHAKHPNLGTLAEPPFCAVRIKLGGISAAGLLTDPDARVLHVRGQPIPGLYACGNTAAPTESGAGYQAGISLMRGLTFGWLAARHAAVQDDKASQGGHRE
ncbi:FAD-dependent oxidoreductase [Roseomonas sp. AR75]|uniref:FAD-dependent oxidoreductase n=1 Tax=Roseomonas sp. AR75 TaxID=2562311 RepID=UPI0014856E96|nr:FAD-dependent oxidoreductase [Roseomonas sp. AR75]